MPSQQSLFYVYIENWSFLLQEISFHKYIFFPSLQIKVNLVFPDFEDYPIRLRMIQKKNFRMQTQ